MLKAWAFTFGMFRVLSICALRTDAQPTKLPFKRLVTASGSLLEAASAPHTKHNPLSTKPNAK